MRLYRRIALLALILYSVFAVGVHLHTHTGTDLVNPDCKLCQASNLSLIQTPETHCSPDSHFIGDADPVAAASTPLQADHIVSGRSPPTA